MFEILLLTIALNIRPLEPVVLKGDQISEFDGQPVGELFCAVLQNGNWEVVPFQLDERDMDGSYFLPDNTLLDANDELVLDPQDGGSMALISNFGDFPDVEGSPRLQIRITDPLNGNSVYFYIFQSTTPPTPSPIEKIQYDSNLDEVTCDHYTVGFDAVHRRWSRLHMWEGGQWSSNLLDREKLRVNGTIFFVPYTIDETNFEFLGLNIVSGPLRIIRQVSYG